MTDGTLAGEASQDFRAHRNGRHQVFSLGDRTMRRVLS
jgi:hypothetical protein